MNSVNFVTNGKKIYTLADNDWYAVEDDKEKVMLVDTDCKVANKELKTSWHNTLWNDIDNGQCILNYTDKIINKYFSSIKYAVLPRNVDCKNPENGKGYGELKKAYMWPMSKEEFYVHQNIGVAIYKNICKKYKKIWTRTFSVYYKGGFHYACSVYGFKNIIKKSSEDVFDINAVAPAFYLDKSKIERITEDGEIILKPALEFVTNE